jgi:hypothetical protein
MPGRAVRALRSALASMLVIGAGAAGLVPAPPARIQFVFTSDAHYGMTRAAFRGRTSVAAQAVNEAMIARINALPHARFPDDRGLNAGQPVGALDFVAEGGDIANRQERTETGAIQPAAVSWAQFVGDYVDGLHVTNASGREAPLYIVPGNHDATNAVGFYRPMVPPIDKTAMVGIYNLMIAPAIRKIPATFAYPRDRVLYSHDIGGVHFVFLTVWPDTASREWMEHDLAPVSASTPVLIIVHDQPDAEAKHFINPNGAHDVNPSDKFENVLGDRFADGTTIAGTSVKEQADFERFLRAHPNVVAYFHGNSNWNQFYDWTGPHHSASLHVFRVDSPIKGAVSANDETALSFQVVTIDAPARAMTVRECLWNRNPGDMTQAIAWGDMSTVSLAFRQAATQ